MNVWLLKIYLIQALLCHWFVLTFWSWHFNFLDDKSKIKSFRFASEEFKWPSIKSCSISIYSDRYITNSCSRSECPSLASVAIVYCDLLHFVDNDICNLLCAAFYHGMMAYGKWYEIRLMLLQKEVTLIIKGSLGFG